MAGAQYYRRIFSLHFSLVPVGTCLISGWYNRIVYTGCLINKISLSLTVLEARKSEIKAQSDSSSAELLLPSGRNKMLSEVFN